MSKPPTDANMRANIELRGLDYGARVTHVRVEVSLDMPRDHPAISEFADALRRYRENGGPLGMDERACQALLIAAAAYLSEGRRER